jgi:RNA recognition motif-containing protein
MNIFVSNLDRSITSGDLRRAFSGYGTVVNAVVMQDTATGKPLGHAHVYLVPEDAARDAIAELQFAPLRGRPIKVRECVYRARRDRRVRQVEGLKVDRRRASDRRREELPDHSGAGANL